LYRRAIARAVGNEWCVHSKMVPGLFFRHRVPVKNKPGTFSKSSPGENKPGTFKNKPGTYSVATYEVARIAA
jgi:hypothetical protein